MRFISCFLLHYIMIIFITIIIIENFKFNVKTLDFSVKIKTSDTHMQGTV